MAFLVAAVPPTEQRGRGTSSPLNAVARGRTRRNRRPRDSGNNVPTQSHSATAQQPQAPPLPLASLSELTERIADLLQVSPSGTTTLSQAGVFAGGAADEPGEYGKTTANVTMVFGKKLSNGQVTLEYARRLVALAKQLEDHKHAEDEPIPSVVAFVSPPGSSGPVSPAAAGYLAFRSICNEAGIDVSAHTFIVDEIPMVTGSRGLHSVLGNLKRSIDPEVLARARYTLISSDYDLFRMQEELRLTPRQSPLRPLQSARVPIDYVFAFYPFCVSKDPATAFFGRITVLCSELSVVLSDLDNVIGGVGFFNAENLVRLRQVSAKLREMTRLIQSPKAIAAEGGFKKDMREQCEVLEASCHAMREVQQRLSPLVESSQELSSRELERCRLLLSGAIQNIQTKLDPDTGLALNDIAAIAEEVGTYETSEREKGKTKLGKAAEAAELSEQTEALETVADVRSTRKRRTATRVTRARSSVKSRSSARDEN